MAISEINFPHKFSALLPSFNLAQVHVSHDQRFVFFEVTYPSLMVWRNLLVTQLCLHSIIRRFSMRQNKDVFSNIVIPPKIENVT